jgi:LCP family protein required for cell wall assembly
MKITLPSLLIVSLTFLLVSCTTAQAEPAAYQPYYFVTAPPDSTATPTPFQPVNLVSSAAQPVIPPTHAQTLVTATLPPLIVTSTPFPTASAPAEAQPMPELVTTPQPLIDAPDTITFLLLGSDLRSGQSYRTDTIVLAIIRPRDGQVSLISIPRDLWVNIPTVGMQRINTAFQYGEIYGYSGGGAGLLKDTLLFNFGLQIDHTALVDFDGFRRIIDTLGGIDVPIFCPYTDWRLIDPSYDPEDENNWTLFTAGPGLIHMDGDYALWYARSRKKSNDFDRGRRQQEVLRSIYAQALRTNTLASLPQLYSDFSTTIQTDLGLGDILQFAPLALHLNNADIRSYYIAGDLVIPWITPGGAYVLLPNTELIQQTINTALAASPRQQERQALTVEIQNGSPYDGWDALVAERLNYAGYDTSFNLADNRDHAQTLLYDLTSDQDRTRSASLLASLGLPDSALVSVPTANSRTSYAVIVGSDYNACFDPQGLAP